MFTTMFLTFMLLMAVQRIHETFFKKGRKKGAIVNKWTLVALTIVHFIVGIGAIVEYFFMQRPLNPIVTCVGFGMYFFALIGRNVAIRNLGEYHSPHIELRDEHPLIKIGLYKYLRHPIYFFTIFELLGVPLIPNSYYAFFFAILTYLPLLFVRLFYEEKAMIERFGEEYLQYKGEVWGVLPMKKMKNGR